MMKKKYIVVLGIIMTMLMMVFAGCGKSDSSSKGGANSAQSQLMFNGSTTISPIISKMAADFTEKNDKWNKVDKSLPDANTTIYVSSGGSGVGVKAVLDKTADFGLVAREVKSEEKEKISDYKEYKIGIDALTVAVNPQNPLIAIKDNLTKEQIKKIFSGEYKTWKDVDASLPANEIVIVTRDLGGGAHEVFQKSIMGDTKVAKNAIQAPSMGALVEKVMTNENAIGYASFGVAMQNQGKLSFFKVDGVAPTVDTILDGSYKIQRPLLIIGRGTMTPLQKTFMDYVMSAEGKKTVEKMGFIPVK